MLVTGLLSLVPGEGFRTSQAYAAVVRRASKGLPTRCGLSANGPAMNSDVPTDMHASLHDTKPSADTLAGCSLVVTIQRRDQLGQPPWISQPRSAKIRTEHMLGPLRHNVTGRIRSGELNDAPALQGAGAFAFSPQITRTL